MARNRSREAETESVNERMLRRGAVKRTHIDRWAVGVNELAPGIVGDTHLGPSAVSHIVNAATTPGATVTLLTETQAIPDDGDVLTWEGLHTVSVSTGFDLLTLPATVLPIPHRAYWRLHVRFEWDDWTGGGTVTIEVDDATVDQVVGTYGRKFSHVAALGVCNEGQRVTVHVDHGDTSSHDLIDAQLTLELVHTPAPTDLSPSEYVFGYDADVFGGTSSVTLVGPEGVSAGDLLVAFVASAEPTVTSPAGFTTASTQTPTSDEKYLIQTRIAVEGDHEVPWTWTATGGGGSDMSLAVILAVIPGVTAVDGTPSFDRETSGTDPTVSTTTTEAAGVLLLATMSQDGAAAVAGFDKVIEETHTSNVSQVFTYALHRAGVTAGVHNAIVTGPDWIVAHLAGVG